MRLAAFKYVSSINQKIISIAMLQSQKPIHRFFVQI